MDKHKFGLRETRDTLIDLLPIRSTYPLRNLPVASHRPIVSYNDSTHIIISHSQPDVFYKLIDDTGHIFEKKKLGNGENLHIQTDILTKEDYTFSVIATKQHSALNNVLLQTVTIQVGVDTSLVVRMAQDIIDYGSTSTVVVEATQRNAKYQAFDTNNNPISDEVLSGEGGDLEILTKPQQEDLTIKVKATNLKTGLNDWMKQKAKVFVRPNLNLSIALAGAPFEYDSKGVVIIKDTQSSTKYLLRYEWIDDDTVDQNKINNTQIIAAKKGNGKDLEIKTTKLQEDIRFNVLAIKTATGIEGQLLQTVVVQVRPDHNKKLILTDQPVDFKKGTFVKVQKSQPGIQYQLLNDANNAKIGWPRYHSRNKGIGVGRLELDFAVDPFTGDSVALPTGAINKTKTFGVLAIKTTTKVTAKLVDKILVELPAE